MKLVIWCLFALVALLWTGGAALLAQLIQWSSQGLVAVGGASAGGAGAGLSLPEWLSPWIDPAVWASLQQTLAAVLSGVSAVSPVLGDLAGWLVPLVWVAWGLGLVVLLGLSLAGTWMARRVQGPGHRGPQPV